MAACQLPVSAAADYEARASELLLDLQQEVKELQTAKERLATIKKGAAVDMACQEGAAMTRHAVQDLPNRSC